jgi:hypothetical protein
MQQHSNTCVSTANYNALSRTCWLGTTILRSLTSRRFTTTKAFVVARKSLCVVTQHCHTQPSHNAAVYFSQTLSPSLHKTSTKHPLLHTDTSSTYRLAGILLSRRIPLSHCHRYAHKDEAIWQLSIGHCANKHAFKTNAWMAYCSAQKHQSVCLSKTIRQPPCIKQ